ncbi:helix-turn-helix domain-containing protein [Pseudomonas sp. 21LCFQ010]|uniref:helix-turn-helix domain-containing protein n=1 Tax=Pseudomonas sp. 21LCFQ010 TaxID=2957506 RepID=UPI0020977206|nr:helix-turn-helix transcriptional regulator [Pseudomonas sp. 21LCFQ010]MCO8163671.1 helix-turn-helix domain-containing protein [Pseudomonas sp. 21LCFQ010]
MSTPINVQIINGPDGTPAFVVIPYADYVRNHPQDDLVPNEVVGYMIKEDMTPIGAWRKHLGLSQSEVAERIGISQPAYAQQEQAARPRKATREKIANALGIAPALLDI